MAQILVEILLQILPIIKPYLKADAGTAAHGGDRALAQKMVDDYLGNQPKP